MYFSLALKSMILTPPVQLIQSYFTCVLDPWNAFYQAVGLANSNTQVYVSLFMLFYMYVVMYFYNRFRQRKVPSKLEKLKRADQEIAELKSIVRSLIVDIKAGRTVGFDETRNLIQEAEETEELSVLLKPVELDHKQYTWLKREEKRRRYNLTVSK